MSAALFGLNATPPVASDNWLRKFQLSMLKR